VKTYPQFLAGFMINDLRGIMKKLSISKLPIWCDEDINTFHALYDQGINRQQARDYFTKRLQSYKNEQ
jgi:hypothetical protein